MIDTSTLGAEALAQGVQRREKIIEIQPQIQLHQIIQERHKKNLYFCFFKGQDPYL